jgi:hypothetical protein
MFCMPDSTLYQRLADTGIGFAGIEGAWWLPAAQPFALPRSVADQLAQFGEALFTFLDTVAALYPHDEALRLTLHHRVPAHIPTTVHPQPVLSLRPDFQLVPQTAGRYHLAVTELEMCPSAQGWAHAMQTAYGLETDLADSFACYLDGREFLFVGAGKWSEFIIEQLAFCRALAERGARARVLYDVPLEVMAREFRAGRRWQPPMFGISSRPDGWNDDLLARLRAHDLLQFSTDEWPAEVADSVVFRFGYLGDFAPEALAHLQRWASSGATFLNPPAFFWESKALMASAGLPSVRATLPADARAVLDRCLPETAILQSSNLHSIAESKDHWILKFAGFDSGQQGWGGRSLQIGAQHTLESWRRVVEHYLDLPFPVVAQRLAPTAQVDVEFVDASGNVQVMRQGHTRLRTFFLCGDSPSPSGRGGRGVRACGSHLTVTGGSMQVSESIDSVQAPVIFP